LCIYTISFDFTPSGSPELSIFDTPCTTHYDEQILAILAQRWYAGSLAPLRTSPQPQYFNDSY
jgi:hypothetical protein